MGLTGAGDVNVLFPVRWTRNIRRIVSLKVLLFLHSNSIFSLTYLYSNFRFILPQFYLFLIILHVTDGEHSS